MTLKRWIGSPQSWGVFGQKANEWLNRLRDQVEAHTASISTNEANLTTHLADASWAKDASSFERSTTSSGLRSADHYGQGHEVYDASDVRVSLLGTQDRIFYADDGSTELLKIERDNNLVIIGEAGTDVLDLGPYYASGIANYDPGYGYGRAIKDANGVVTLQGLVSNSGGTVAADTLLLLLPAGYRPARRHIFAAAHSHAAFARLDVAASGVVLLPTNTLPTGGWFSLSGISYATYE